jgi:tRNA (cytosine38-C5)-methyltransferase
MSLDDYEKICFSQISEKIIWTMSPPCQPFTRQGNQNDLNDLRSKGFIQLMTIQKE